MAAFQFYLQSGKHGKVGWVGNDSHYFWQKIPWSKQKCETMPCRDATASYFVAKVRSEVFAELTIWPARTNSLWIIPSLSKKIDEYALDVSCLFCLCEFELSIFGLCFPPRTLVSTIIQRCIALIKVP
jgi:hypothetical protein